MNALERHLKIDCCLWKQSGLMWNETDYRWHVITGSDLCRGAADVRAHKITPRMPRMHRPTPGKQRQHRNASLKLPFGDLGKKGRECPRKPLHCVFLSVIKKEHFWMILIFSALTGKSIVTATLSWACFLWGEALQSHRKGIGFEEECMDEQTLIYFFRSEAVMRFWLATGQGDYCQIKIRVNWCLCAGKKKAEFVLLSLAVCCIDIRGPDIRPRLTLTAHQRALGEEMRKCDGGKSLERCLRPRYADRKICE